MLPLVRLGLAAVAIFTAIQAWNEFLFGHTMTAGRYRAGDCGHRVPRLSVRSHLRQMAAAGSHLAWSMAPPAT
jgi:ABC-type glycerol-3-phosphate transport system permease component